MIENFSPDYEKKIPFLVFRGSSSTYELSVDGASYYGSQFISSTGKEHKYPTSKKDLAEDVIVAASFQGQYSYWNSKLKGMLSDFFKKAKDGYLIAGHSLGLVNICIYIIYFR